MNEDDPIFLMAKFAIQFMVVLGFSLILLTILVVVGGVVCLIPFAPLQDICTVAGYRIR